LDRLLFWLLLFRLPQAPLFAKRDESARRNLRGGGGASSNRSRYIIVSATDMIVALKIKIPKEANYSVEQLSTNPWSKTADPQAIFLLCYALPKNLFSGRFQKGNR
jgi:hypothetical protein